LSAPAVRECAERLAGLVMELRKIAPVDVYSVPGNHGRLTKKPESKDMAINSFDTLITTIVEMVVNLSGTKNVKFFYPQSGDAVFSVYQIFMRIIMK
jgi:DNA repair exonuclease SbcCD nuclease subunit